VKIVLWSAGLAAAVLLALAANVVLLRTDGSRGDPAGSLSPKLVHPVERPTLAPAATTTSPEADHREEPTDGDDD
jgi:hypothetical protein